VHCLDFGTRENVQNCLNGRVCREFRQLRRLTLAPHLTDRRLAKLAAYGHHPALSRPFRELLAQLVCETLGCTFDQVNFQPAGLEANETHMLFKVNLEPRIPVQACQVDDLLKVARLFLRRRR